MKILGVDISSTCTGWALIEGDNLLDHGKIVPTKHMTLGQKLCLFGKELSKVIEKHKPAEIAVEDVVQCSSVSVTKILSRFNGVALIEAYKYLQRDAELYEPSKWKKHLEGCTGSAKKAEIQLSICKKYNLLTQEKIKFYQERIDKCKSMLCDSKEKVKDEQKLELKQLKKDLKKAKKDSDNNQIEILKEKIKSLMDDRFSKSKANKKIVNEEFDKISLDIYSETSIDDNVADAAGVAITLQSYK